VTTAQPTCRSASRRLRQPALIGFGVQQQHQLMRMRTLGGPRGDPNRLIAMAWPGAVRAARLACRAWRSEWRSCSRNYVPWKGYFDLMRRVRRVSIVYDEVQYNPDATGETGIASKSPSGVRWADDSRPGQGPLPPARRRGRSSATLAWAEQALGDPCEAGTARRPFFEQYRSVLEAAYLGCEESHPLAHQTGACSRWSPACWASTTPCSSSLDYEKPAARRPSGCLGICKAAGATSYLSGPAAKDYFEESLFRRWLASRCAGWSTRAILTTPSCTLRSSTT